MTVWSGVSVACLRSIRLIYPGICLGLIFIQAHNNNGSGSAQWFAGISDSLLALLCIGQVTIATASHDCRWLPIRGLTALSTRLVLLPPRRRLVPLLQLRCNLLCLGGTGYGFFFRSEADDDFRFRVSVMEFWLFFFFFLLHESWLY